MAIKSRGERRLSFFDILQIPKQFASRVFFHFSYLIC